LLVPRLADYCVVHLDGYSPDEILVVHVDPTKVELVREILRSSPPGGSHSHRQAVRTGKSLLVESMPEGFLESAAEMAEQLALMRRLARARYW
jgi:hypothetical protein